jgi:hypothetical protein
MRPDSYKCRAMAAFVFASVADPTDDLRRFGFKPRLHQRETDMKRDSMSENLFSRNYRVRVRRPSASGYNMTKTICCSEKV